MKLALMGSADLAVPALRSLVDAGYDIARVYSQPPRPAGRGHRERQTPVHAEAARLGLSVVTPRSLKSAVEQQAFAGLGLDAAVVAAYGLLLPPPVLAAPRLGCINIHASLLPRWRGAAPIQRAILAGDKETGVTIMQMEAGLDTGPMLLRQTVPITDTTNAQTLHDELATLGAKLLLEVLPQLDRGEIPAVPQPDEGATYAKKLARDEGRINWSWPAEQLDRHVRALNPTPGVWCMLGDMRLKILSVELLLNIHGEPGVILDDRLTVACGAGALRLRTVQRPGKAPMAAEDFLRGHAVTAGDRLG